MSQYNWTSLEMDCHVDRSFFSIARGPILQTKATSTMTTAKRGIDSKRIFAMTATTPTNFTSVADERWKRRCSFDAFKSDVSTLFDSPGNFGDNMRIVRQVRMTWDERKIERSRKRQRRHVIHSIEMCLCARIFYSFVVCGIRKFHVHFFHERLFSLPFFCIQIKFGTTNNVFAGKCLTLLLRCACIHLVGMRECVCVSMWWKYQTEKGWRFRLFFYLEIHIQTSCVSRIHVTVWAFNLITIFVLAFHCHKEKIIIFIHSNEFEKHIFIKNEFRRSPLTWTSRRNCWLFS